MQRTKKKSCHFQQVWQKTYFR